MTSLFCVWRMPALLVLFAFLSACGGGGGGGGSDGGGNNNPPPAATGNAWLPTSTSIQWVYNDTIPLAFEGPTSSKGHTIHGLVYPTQGREYFSTTANAIYLAGIYLPSIQADRTYTGDIHLDNLFPVLGNDWGPFQSGQVSGTGTIDIVPTYGKRSLNYTGTVIYQGQEAIETDIGVFPAKKVDVNLTFTATVDGNTFTLPYKVTYWFAKDVGIVRRDQQGVSYKLSTATGLDDADGDGFYGADDKFPQDGTRWEVAPLYASDDGIALTSVPSFSRLEQTVTIMEGSAPASAAWNAMSNQSWLTVAPQAGSRLRIVADPTGLAQDSLNYATITVSSNGSDVAATPATIRVALWVGSQDAPTSASITASPWLAVDPLRPYVYIANGHNIDIYNVYTQALVDSIPVTQGSPAVGGDMQITSDGSYLYLRTSNNFLRKIALDAPYDQMAIMKSLVGQSFALARPQGHRLLLDHNGNIYDANSGATVAGAFWYSANMNGVVPSVSVPGDRACAGLWYPAVSLSCYQFSYAAGTTPALHVRRIGNTVLNFPHSGVAIGNSGEDMYAVIDGRIRHYRIDGMQNLGEGSAPAYLSVVRVAADDIVYGNSSDSGNNSGSFDPDMTPRAQYLHPVDYGQFGISGDGAVRVGFSLGGLAFQRNY